MLFRYWLRYSKSVKVKYNLLSDEFFFLESYKENSISFFWGNNWYNFLSSIERRLVVPKVFHNEIWILIHFSFLFPIYVYVSQTSKCNEIYFSEFLKAKVLVLSFLCHIHFHYHINLPQILLLFGFFNCVLSPHDRKCAVYWKC